MDTIFFSDIENNHYLFSSYKRQLIYLDSCLYELCLLYWEKHNSLAEIDNLLSERYLNNEIEDALKMFELLCKNDYFKSHTPNIIHDFNFQEFDYSDLKTVTFEVTQRCNLRCKYCINGDMYNHDENDYTDNLSFEKAKAVIDFLIDKIQGGSSVKSKITFGFYGGEPLLQIDLIKEIVEYINKNVSPITPIDFTMTTNGLLLKEHIDFIVNNNFLLLVSFDGNRKHSEYRIPIGEEKLFSKLYNNIKFIQKEYPSYFKERITFNTVLHDKTELAPILEFFKNEFEKLPLLSELSGEGIKDQDMFRKMYKSSDDEVEAIADEISYSDYMKISPRVSFSNKFFDNLLIARNIRSLHAIDVQAAPNEQLTSGTCMPFSFKLFVSATGKLYPCERVGYRYSFGYINEQQQVIVDLKAINNLYKTLFEKVVEKCRVCYNIYSCSTCLLSSEGRCSYQTKEEFTKELTTHINNLIKRKKHLENHEDTN